MGEAHGRFLEPTFNQTIKLRQADPRITSDAGAILPREIDHRLGLTADLAGALIDPRDPEAIRYTRTELLRQHVYAGALGYAHQDDADTLAHDVAMKLAVWDRPGCKVIDERLASQPSDWRLVRRIADNGWDLKRVRQTVLKAGALVTEHGRRLIVDVAAAAGVLWGRLLGRVAKWWRDATWGRNGPRHRDWVTPPSHAHLCLVLRE
jgi:hypothetical protein